MTIARPGADGHDPATAGPAHPDRRPRRSLTWPGLAWRGLAWVAGPLIVWAVLARLLPKGLPPGIVVLGVIYGSLYALVAIGIVLVYRANRIINFAQAQLGVVAAILAIELHVTYGVSYILSCLAGIGAAIALGAVISLLPRHFRKSSRLILTVATIALAQALTGVATIVPLWFCDPAKNQACITATRNQSFNTPVNVHFSISPVVFMGNDIVAFAGAAAFVLALTLFLHHSKYGVAIRAAADNGDRAMLLGIPVPRLDTIVWCLAAVLSAAAVLLRVPVLGFSSFQTVSGGGDELLLFTLAAAVIGRMESLPRTAVAAIAIGIYESLATWTFANTTFVDATLVLVIVIALLIQKDAYRRVSNSLGSTWRDVASVRPIPRQLAQLGEVRWSSRVVKLALLAAAVVLPLILTTSQTYLAALILIYAIVGLSLLVLTGWAGQISLGQFALAGVGGATTAVLFQRHGWDFVLAVAAGVAVGALTALVIGVPALRIQGPFLAVTTLAFGLSVSTYFLAPNNLPWFVTTQINRPTIFGADVLGQDWQIYYFCLISFLLVMLAVRSLRRSRTGRALIATRDNEAATRAAAVSTTRMKLTAFAISGGIAGFAGSIFVVHQRGVNNGSFSADISIALFLMVVVGGAGSLPGVVIGAIYVWGTQYYLHGGFSLVASGLGILLLLIVLPEGLGGLLYRLRDGLLRELARRKGIPLRGPIVRATEPSGPDRGATAILEQVAPPNGSPGARADHGRAGDATRLPTGPSTADDGAPVETPEAIDVPQPSSERRPGPRDDRRSLTGGTRLLPLIVVAGLGAMAQLNALALILLLPDLRDSFHSSLFFVSTIVVAGIQVGLLIDVAVGALANRVRRMRLLCGGMGLVAVCSVLVAVAGHVSSILLLDIATAAITVAGWAFTSTQNSILADCYPIEARPRVYFVHRAIVAGAAGGWTSSGGRVGTLLRLADPLPRPRHPHRGARRARSARPCRTRPSPRAQRRRRRRPGTHVRRDNPGALREPVDPVPVLCPPVLGDDRDRRSSLHRPALPQRLPRQRVRAPARLRARGTGQLRRTRDRPVRHPTPDDDRSGACDAHGVAHRGRGRRFPARGRTGSVPGVGGRRPVRVRADRVLAARVDLRATVSTAAPPRMLTLAFALTSVWFGFGVILIAPAGLSLVSTVDGLLGYRAGFWCFAGLVVIGAWLLAVSARHLNRDIEKLHVTALADAEICRAWRRRTRSAADDPLARCWL